MSKYTVAKRDGLWWVLDEDGYEISYVGYETKKEALELARVRAAEDCSPLIGRLVRF